MWMNLSHKRIWRRQNMEELIKKVEAWSIDCNLHKADSKKQLMILLEEFGELNASILRDDADGVKDAIGDMMAILIILCQQKKEPYFSVRY